MTLTDVPSFKPHRLMEPTGYAPPAEHSDDHYGEQMARAAPKT